MVTNYGGTGDLMCSSTDVKPTDVAVNTRCLELDTGKFWYFDGTTWTETPGGGGGGGSATLIEKSITANGTYTASADNADGYSSVDVSVPNTYTVDDNGKVVSNQALVAQTAKPDTITVNDTYNTTEYNSVIVNVPNTYTAGDEGKVVSGGDLVAQSAYPSTITTNDTYDTTNYNSVTVNVGGDNSDLINLIERDITSITIPSGVTTIGDSAFNQCTHLSSISIPSGVITIGDSAFNQCTHLSSISIPDSVTSIGDSAFSRCTNLSSITIPSGVTSIGQNVFYNCVSLTSVSMTGITTIPYGMFYGCTAFKDIEIPSSVTRIEARAFYDISATSIKFLGSTPPTVTNANAWNKILVSCKIYVPTGSLTAYTTAANYPDPNTYTYVEY